MESEEKQTVGTSGKLDKYGLIIPLIILLGIAVYGVFFSKSNGERPSANTEEEHPSQQIWGSWYLQPQQRELSLNLATLHSVIQVNFIDSVYCNVNISSAAGDVSLSRTYTMAKGLLTLEDPTTGSIKKYELENFSPNGLKFSMRGADGYITFIAYGVDDRIEALMKSENTLKRNEFLYPNLSPGERANGTTQVHEVNGRIVTIEDPNRAEIEKIDVYKMF